MMRGWIFLLCPVGFVRTFPRGIVRIYSLLKRMDSKAREYEKTAMHISTLRFFESSVTKELAFRAGLVMLSRLSRFWPVMLRDARRCRYFVAFSSFFIIEKMKRAEMRQSAISMLQSTHKGSPPQSIPITDTR